MPAIALLPAIIGAGAGIGGAFINKKASNNASKGALDAANNDPLKLAQTDLIKQNAAQSKWGFDQAQGLLPTVKGAIDLPFNQYSAVLSGDPNAFNKVLAPMNTAIDKQTASLRSNTELSSRGAVAGRLATINTQNAQAKQGGYWDAWATSLQGAQQGAGQYQTLMNSLFSAGNQASGNALGAIGGIQSNQTALQLQKQALGAQALGGLGTGIGQILTGLLMKPKGGSSRSGSGTLSGGGISELPWDLGGDD